MQHPYYVRKEKKKTKHKNRKFFGKDEQNFGDENGNSIRRHSVEAIHNHRKSRKKSTETIRDLSKTGRNSVEPILESNEVPQSTGIPVPVDHNHRERTPRYSHRDNSCRSKSPLKNYQGNGWHDNHQKRETVSEPLDVDEIKTPRDRKKWDIPQVKNLKSDKKGSLRLPPLAELRLAKTA